MRHAAGHVRDAILKCFKNNNVIVALKDIYECVEGQIGKVPRSSIRSWLNENTPERLVRVSHGKYRLKK
jgi:hypothetical protein